MRKIALYSGALFAALFVLYSILSALVNQGLSIAGALVMLVIIVVGGIGLLLAVRN